jgi:threonine dehydrogenase-like Zn-dependent dehydrogenase
MTHKLHGYRARLLAPRDFLFEPHIVDVAALAPDEICAVTDFSAISIGTEKAAYAGLPPLRIGPAYPRLMGYCNAAHIVKVGSAVRHFRPDMRILTTQSHQSCFVCPADEILGEIPDELESRTACLAYIAHIGMSAFLRAGLKADESVAIQGLGPIGLAAIPIAKALGARKILAVGNAPTRIDRARALGASLAVSCDDPDINRSWASHNDGKMADIVLSTVNSWEGWKSSLSLVREFGRIAVVGFPGRGEPLPDFNPLASDPFYIKQPTVLSTGLAAGPDMWGDGDPIQFRKDNIARLFAWMTNGTLSLGSLINREVPWRELESIYRQAAGGDKSIMAAVLRWEGAT